MIIEYIVRIELHHAGAEDYTKLHIEMHKCGFSTTIKGKNGTYKLPHGECFIKTALDIEQARAIASKAVTHADKDGKILISECVNMAWSGLEKI